MTEVIFTVERHEGEALFRYGPLLISEIWAEWFDACIETGQPRDATYEVRRANETIYRGRVFYMGGHDGRMLFGNRSGIDSNYASKLYPERFEAGDIIVFDDPRRTPVSELQIRQMHAMSEALDAAFDAHDDSLSARELVIAVTDGYRNTDEAAMILRFRR